MERKFQQKRKLENPLTLRWINWTVVLGGVACILSLLLGLTYLKYSNWAYDPPKKWVLAGCVFSLLSFVYIGLIGLVLRKKNFSSEFQLKSTRSGKASPIGQFLHKRRSEIQAKKALWMCMVCCNWLLVLGIGGIALGTRQIVFELEEVEEFSREEGIEVWLQDEEDNHAYLFSLNVNHCLSRRMTVGEHWLFYRHKGEESALGGSLLQVPFGICPLSDTLSY